MADAFVIRQKICQTGENMNCFFNHPRPIFCPALRVNCENQIVNPVVLSDYGYFYNTAPGEIETETTIPLALVLSRGTSISASTTTAGAINLLPGTYEITYTVGGEIAAGGTLSAELELNGIDVVGSVLTETGTAGNEVNLSNTLLLNVTAVSTLELVNNTAETATFTFAGVSITRL